MSAGTDERVHILQLSPTFGETIDSQRKAQEHIDVLWKLIQCTLLYMSSGAGRGLELTRIHPFSHYQEYHNSLRFEMRSEKNVIHGVDRNESTTHLIPPSLARFVLIINKVIYPLAEACAHLSIPSLEAAPSAAAEIFCSVMQLPTIVTTKICRDFLVQIMNYLSPEANGKFTTSKERAEQFHHSWKTHGNSYSSTVFERCQNGDIRELPLTIARHFWNALGEKNQHSCELIDRDLPTLSSDVYDIAAARALRDPSIKCYRHQKEACTILDDNTRHENVILHAATGYGKSGVWNYNLMARSITGSKKPKSIVICPYNPNLTQQELNSKKIFFGTNVKVYSITSSTIEQMVLFASDFDLLYISMDAFQTLRCSDSYKGYLESWDVKIIYVDEFHCSFTEHFRHENSWQGLRNLSALGAKICLLTATTNATATKMIAHYCGIGVNFIVVGGPSQYSLPNVGFEVRQTQNELLPTEIVSHISQRLSPPHVRTNTAIHVITVSREEAETLSRMINEVGIKADWLTSECSKQEREYKIQSWDMGNLSVLVSTYCLGLDNAKVREVIIAGGCGSVCDAIQSAGRIRPRQQNGDKTKVYFWLGNRDWMKDNLQMQQNTNYLEAAGYFECFSTQQDITNAKMEIEQLYGHIGLDGVIYNTNKCIMVGLHQRLGVMSSDCGICDFCKRENAFFRNIQEARDAERKHSENKHFVMQQMSILAERCIVCERKECNGFGCIGIQTYCFRCFGNTGRGSRNFHSREQCACASGKFKTENKSCPNCFMAIGGDIPNCGTQLQHQQGNCIHKDRIKRILLHDLIGSCDGGISAFRRLEPILQNHRLWIDMMARNIRIIQSSK